MATAERAAREIMDEKQCKELKFIENRVKMEIASQSQERKENDDRFSQALDESVYSVKLELTKEKKQREEMEDEFSGEITSNVTKLNEVIENE